MPIIFRNITKKKIKINKQLFIYLRKINSSLHNKNNIEVCILDLGMSSSPEVYLDEGTHVTLSVSCATRLHSHRNA